MSASRCMGHYLFQCEPPHQSDECLRGGMQAVRVRTQERCGRLLHHGAGRGVADGGAGILGSRHRIPYCRRTASGPDAGVFPRPDRRTEAAVSARSTSRRSPWWRSPIWRKRAKLSTPETLEKLKDAGVDSMPGGGAEIFSDRVRHIICDHKIDGERVAGYRAHGA